MKKLRLLLPLVFTLAVFTIPGAQAVEFEEQIKLDVPKPSDFSEIKGLPKILTYKVKHIGEYVYQDYYYDTPDLKLFKMGYSYRFRIRNKGNANALEYGVQFKREYDPQNSENFKRQEIDVIIPHSMAASIQEGHWSDAYSDAYHLQAITRFRKFLAAQHIDPKSLVPVIYGKQSRSRYRLKEGHTTYFEISMDDCMFKTVAPAKPGEVHLHQLEFENKYRKDQSSIPGRIQALIDFFTQHYGLKVDRDSKYRTAINDLLIHKRK